MSKVIVRTKEQKNKGMDTHICRDNKCPHIGNGKGAFDTYKCDLNPKCDAMHSASYGCPIPIECPYADEHLASRGMYELRCDKCHEFEKGFTRFIKQLSKKECKNWDKCKTHKCQDQTIDDQKKCFNEIVERHHKEEAEKKRTQWVSWGTSTMSREWNW